MALPKEPRQKMINIMYLVLTAILALNVSAEVINAFRVVNNSLETSNANISAATNNLYKDLADKLNKAETKERANIWAPKAMQAKKYSDAMMVYIDSLKQDLKVAAGLRMKWDDRTKDSVEDFKMDNLDASTRLFETKGEGKNLEDRLEQYKKDMLGIDPTILANFEHNFPVSTRAPRSQDGTKKDFTQSFFHMTPTISALTILSKFQNNIKNAENEIVTFCDNQIGAVAVHMDQTGILVGQSSNYLMPGQKLTITAGVGAYSSAASPTISIDGSNVAVNGGQGSTTITAGGAGEHSIPVTVTYKDENGNTKTQTETITYTVGTPGNAAVMLDKMNVFYIGVDNPVTINSGTGDEKTHATISSGSITKTGPGKYIVRVSTPGKTTINVSAENKSTPFDFRVKEIPDPVFKVGPSKGGRIQSVVFKNQQYCRADLENFDFQANFSVVSATVYFSGANFPSVQQATINGPNLGSIQSQLARCIPGTSVTFDNVKVKGPDGKERTIQGPGFILY
ncbi:MAG TPA: gliding motility protein GldM [Chitinophagaceae bacterium]|nr:gliding motility protein GldM [Chitinophagaceae bacterium]